MVALRLAYARPAPTFLPVVRWLRQAWLAYWRSAQWSIAQLHRIPPRL